MLENFKKYCKENSIGFFLPICFVLAIVPLIVRAKQVQLDSVTADLLKTSSIFELFSQNKALLLMIFSAIILVFSIVYHKYIFEKKDLIVNIILGLSIIFLILSLVSTLCSPYRNAALWGVYNRAEGFITILCYLLLFIYSIFTFKTTKDYHCLLNAILVVVFVNAFLGLFQYFGSDLIKTSLGRLIVIPRSFGNGSISLQYDSGHIYGTLFHYNYVGSFSAIVIPILFCAMIMEFDIGYKLTLGMGFISSVWLLLGSTSRAGIVGVIVSIITALIAFSRILLKNKKKFLIIVTCIIACIIGINFISHGKIFQRIPSLCQDAVSIFSNTGTDYKETVPVRDITYNNDGSANLVLKNSTLTIAFTGKTYKFTDEQGNEIIPGKGEKGYILNSDKYKDVIFKLGNTSNASTFVDAIQFTISNQPGAVFTFKVKEDNSIHLVDSINYEDIDYKEAPSFGFKGKEKLGSSRGYIWSRSIPLLKNNIIKGQGPDTFLYVFPNNDIIGKLAAYDTTSMLVDKPHDLYLQIGLNNGVIALLIFLAIVLIYIIDTFRLYAFKKEYQQEQIIGIALCASITAYLAAGIFNDSVIGVAPFFWVILGCGIALNFENRKALKRQK